MMAGQIFWWLSGTVGKWGGAWPGLTSYYMEPTIPYHAMLADRTIPYHTIACWYTILTITYCLRTQFHTLPQHTIILDHYDIPYHTTPYQSSYYPTHLATYIPVRTRNFHVDFGPIYSRNWFLTNRDEEFVIFFSVAQRSSYILRRVLLTFGTWRWLTLWKVNLCRIKWAQDRLLLKGDWRVEERTTLNKQMNCW